MLSLSNREGAAAAAADTRARSRENYVLANYHQMNMYDDLASCSYMAAPWAKRNDEEPGTHPQN